MRGRKKPSSPSRASARLQAQAKANLKIHISKKKEEAKEYGYNSEVSNSSLELEKVFDNLQAISVNLTGEEIDFPTPRRKKGVSALPDQFPLDSTSNTSLANSDTISAHVTLKDDETSQGFSSSNDRNEGFTDNVHLSSETPSLNSSQELQNAFDAIQDATFADASSVQAKKKKKKKDLSDASSVGQTLHVQGDNASSAKEVSHTPAIEIDGTTQQIVGTIASSPAREDTTQDALKVEETCCTPNMGNSKNEEDIVSSPSMENATVSTSSVSPSDSISPSKAAMEEEHDGTSNMADGTSPLSKSQFSPTQAGPTGINFVKISNSSGQQRPRGSGDNLEHGDSNSAVSASLHAGPPTHDENSNYVTFDNGEHTSCLVDGIKHALSDIALAEMAFKDNIVGTQNAATNVDFFNHVGPPPNGELADFAFGDLQNSNLSSQVQISSGNIDHTVGHHVFPSNDIKIPTTIVDSLDASTVDVGQSITNVVFEAHGTANIVDPITSTNFFSTPSNENAKSQSSPLNANNSYMENFPTIHSTQIGKSELTPHTVNSATISGGRKDFFVGNLQSSLKLDFFASDESDEDGEPIACPPQNVYEEGNTLWDNCLIGQFIGKPPPVFLIETMVKNQWKKFENIDIKSTDKGLYVFQFDNKSICEVVLEEFWHVNHRPLLLRKWDPNIQLVDIKADRVPMWMQLKNVPLSPWTRKRLSYVASTIGFPLQMDSVMASRNHLRYARVCIEVNLEKALKDVTKVKLPNGNIAFVDIEYSWKPQKCNHCNIIGHSTINCPNYISPVSEIPIKRSDDQAAAAISTENTDHGWEMTKNQKKKAKRKNKQVSRANNQISSQRNN